MPGDVRTDVEGTDEDGGERDPGDGGDDADDHREPQAVDALGERTAEVAGAEVARHAGGGAVGEEDAQADRGLQDDRRDAEAGELGGAEVADDRGVGEQEDRLGDERQEGRDGESQDLAVDGLHVSQPRKGRRTSRLRGGVRC